jgi:hypothetical protein
MIWEALTILNFFGSIFAIYCLITVVKNYKLAPRMEFYIIISIISMLLLCFGQAYQLTEKPDVGWLKFTGLFWWLKTLYLSWAVRFTSVGLRKESKVKEIINTNR